MKVDGLDIDVGVESVLVEENRTYAQKDVANTSDFRRDDRTVKLVISGVSSFTTCGSGQTLRRTTRGSLTSFGAD